MIHFLKQIFKKKPDYTHMIITPYFFGPSERTIFTENLQYLDETGAEVIYSRFDEQGGVIEVVTKKY